MTLDIGQGLVGLRRTFYMGYAQDEVKLTPNLTLNAGLRYEFYSVMHEVQGPLSHRQSRLAAGSVL